MRTTLALALALAASCRVPYVRLQPGDYELTRVALRSTCSVPLGRYATERLRYLGGYLGAWRCVERGSQTHCESTQTTAAPACSVEVARRLWLRETGPTHEWGRVLLGEWSESQRPGPGCDLMSCSVSGDAMLTR